MVRRKYIIKRKIEVIIPSILEMFGFALLCAFVWHFWE